MSGEQLERSILERKEREELHAIAEAMALKPAARSKKADIIDQILHATGIEVGAAKGAATGNGKSASSTVDGDETTAPRRANGTGTRARATAKTAAAADTDADTAGSNGATAEGPAKAKRVRKTTKAAAEVQTLA